jgi:hypothetical protein
MLRLEFDSHNGFLTIKNVISIACGKGSSRLICIDHKPTKIFISSGKMYVLHLADRARIVQKFYHTEGVLTVEEGGTVSFVAGRIYERKDEQKHKLQTKLENQTWKEFMSERTEHFDKPCWLDENNNPFKYF